MGFFTRQFIDIIQWEDNSSDTIVHKAPIEANQIQNGATLIVQPGQVAIFRVFDGSKDSSGPLNTVTEKYNSNVVGTVNGGSTASASNYVKGKTFAAEIFGEGTYELNTGVVPILSDLMGFARGFQSNVKAFVYFVSLKNFMGMKWGTPGGGVQLIDVAFGDVQIQSFGNFSFRIKNPDMFTKNISGTDEDFKIADMERLGNFDSSSSGNPIKSYVCSSFADAICEAYGNVVDITLLQGKKREIARLLKEIVNEMLEENEWGIEVNSINIESIHLPKFVQDRLNERTAVNTQGGFGAARTIASIEAMRGAVNNPSGGSTMGMFAQAGLGASMGREFAGTLNGAFAADSTSSLDERAALEQQAKLNQYKKSNSLKVYSCGCGYESADLFKFCPECGNKYEEKVQEGIKFCSECGVECQGNAKFCPECGNKF